MKERSVDCPSTLPINMLSLLTNTTDLTLIIAFLPREHQKESGNYVLMWMLEDNQSQRPKNGIESSKKLMLSSEKMVKESWDSLNIISQKINILKDSDLTLKSKISSSNNNVL